MGAEQLALAIDGLRDQVKALVAADDRGGPVRIEMRRTDDPMPVWRFTARFRAAGRPPRVVFTRRWVDVDGRRVELDTHVLEFVEVGWTASTLTVCVAEVRAGELLRLANDAAERLADPAKMIAVTRALRAVSRAVENAPADTVAEAAASASDIGVVVRTLQQPSAIEALKRDDPLGAARLRGLEERQHLLEIEGGTWTVAEVADHLGLTRQAVNRRRQLGSLIGLDAGRHGYLYPAWQFGRRGTVPHLDALLDSLHERDPWMQHIFAVTPNQRLGGVTPLDALRQDRLDPVLKAARAFGEHGAA